MVCNHFYKKLRGVDLTDVLYHCLKGIIDTAIQLVNVVVVVHHTLQQGAMAVVTMARVFGGDPYHGFNSFGGMTFSYSI